MLLVFITIDCLVEGGKRYLRGPFEQRARGSKLKGLRVRARARARAKAKAKARALRVRARAREVKEVKRHVPFRVIGGRVIAVVRIRVITIVITMVRAKGVSQIQRQMPLILAALQLSPPSPIYGIRASSRPREILMTRF